MIRSLLLIASVLNVVGCQTVGPCEFEPKREGWIPIQAPQELIGIRGTSKRGWYRNSKGEVAYCPGRFGVCGGYYRVYVPTDGSFVLTEEVICLE